MAQPLAMDNVFPCYFYPIVTVFSPYVLDMNTWSCVASSALYTLTISRVVLTNRGCELRMLLTQRPRLSQP